MSVQTACRPAHIALVLVLSVASTSASAQGRCDEASGQSAARGWTAYRRDSITIARAEFARALDGCAANSDAQVGIGFVSLREGKLDEADRAFTAVTARDSEYADAWDGLATTRNRRGDTPSAIAAQ